MEKSDAEIEALTNAVIGGGIEVHRELGPGYWNRSTRSVW
jgi:hypothetical protein